MKQKSLQFPYRWADRHPLLQDGVFFLPEHYFEHDPKFLGEIFSFFGNDNPICIEYCSGNGEWIINRAERNPQINWIAVEKKFKRVRKIWSKMKNANLSNLLIVRGVAETFTQHYLPDQIIERIYINFPDPWPKERHAKNRILKEPFVSELARITAPHSTAMVVTDDIDFSSIVIQEMLQNEKWRSSFDAPHYVNEFAEYGSSYFERLWREKGKEIRYMEFRKK